MPAGLALPYQSLGEEALEQPGEAVPGHHDAAPQRRSRRDIA